MCSSKCRPLVSCLQSLRRGPEPRAPKDLNILPESPTVDDEKKGKSFSASSISLDEHG